MITNTDCSPFTGLRLEELMMWESELSLDSMIIGMLRVMFRDRDRDGCDSDDEQEGEGLGGREEGQKQKQ